MVPSISNVAIACLLLLAASGCRSSAFVLPAPTTSRVTKNKTSNGGQSLIADASLPWASRRRSIYRYTTTLHYLHRPDSDTSSVNFYSVLGVTRDATESDIKGAFRKLAKLYHPGKQQESEYRKNFSCPFILPTLFRCRLITKYSVHARTLCCKTPIRIGTRQSSFKC